MTSIIGKLSISGAEVWPLVEGGKGIAVSTGVSAGHWAAAGGVGTLSAVNADSYDEGGNPVSQIYRAQTRRERQQELIRYAIRGGIEQARIAHEIAGGKGRIHANFLWEMGGAEEVISGILEGAPGLVHGITCGAGMPYQLSEIAARFNVYYYPIVSSGRAFNALWRRSFSRMARLLGGVVYEDPWRAGGHNGLSNSEDPLKPEDPYPRVVALRRVMRGYGLDHVPIIMAGGVWRLDEWKDWIDSEELGPIAFQLGTRPLLTKESPIPLAWKERLRTLKKGDVCLNRFSPTGFYSSAVNNDFLKELRQRSARQLDFSFEKEGEFSEGIAFGARGRQYYFRPRDAEKARGWKDSGFDVVLRTPDNTLVFVDEDRARRIRQDQLECMGCLSQCQFSNWSQKPPAFETGRRPDPRSFCIQKTLQAIAHLPNDLTPETEKAIDHNLMFGGTNAWRFASDPYYANGFTPAVQELVERLLTGQ